MFTTKQKFGLGRLYLDATAEAQRRGDRRVGTEHVTLALLVDPGYVTVRALDVSLTTARNALEALDRRALASVGIESPPGPHVAVPGREKGRLRLTPGAKAVFTDLRKESKGERLGVQHVLLALLSRQQPDPAAELLDELGVDRAEVRRRLAAA